MVKFSCIQIYNVDETCVYSNTTIYDVHLTCIIMILTLSQEGVTTDDRASSEVASGSQLWSSEQSTEQSQSQS